jgi:hypothetical protein
MHTENCEVNTILLFFSIVRKTKFAAAQKGDICFVSSNTFSQLYANRLMKYGVIWKVISSKAKITYTL